MGEIQQATGRTAAPAAAPPGTALAVTTPTPMEAARSAYEHSLQAKVQYAKTLAGSGLLPAIYRKNPANVLWALEYGEALRISPMAAIIGIHVIEGKPCAGAGLISGLVRKAGHRLRIRGDDKTATCDIIRADDPEFTFTATWTMERAVKANLTGKSVWKQYPAAMLRARAITEAARAACQDVLFGLGYTPEELGADAMDDSFIPGEIILADAAPAEPAGGREQLQVIAEHFTRLGVEQDRRLEAARLLVDREHLSSADDLDGDERDHIQAELEGCQEPEDLQTLLAERAAIG